MEAPIFINSWDHYMAIGAYVSLGIAILILLYHEFRIFQIKDFKEKYDYVNLYEIRFFWYAVLAVMVTVAFFANTLGTEEITSGGRMLWFYVRLFITVCFVIIGYFVFFSMVRIYYPRSVAKRLKKLRNTPRISPDGNLMRKLSEEEEDAHLEASQIAEESSDVHSVDYDVWIDEKTGYKKVEKYMSYLHAEECPDCGYFTLKIDSEEVEKNPTESEEGILVKHYRCSYCNHRELREVTLAMLSENVA
jgi:hypothetical protein